MRRARKRPRPAGPILLLAVLALIIVGIGHITRDRPKSQPVHPMSAPAAKTLPPADWSIPKRYRGKLVAMRVRHFPEKIIALTFDDGPSANITPKVLKALAEHGARATFFVQGVNAKRHPELLKAIVAQGSVIGNHSYSHPKQVSPAGAVREINRTAEIIRRATGHGPCCFRPPYGITRGNLAHVASKECYPVVTWTVSTADASHVPAEEMVTNVLDTPSPGDIVLMHDAADHGPTAEAVPQILDRLSAMGYRCVTIPDLLRAWDQWLTSTGKLKTPNVRLRALNVEP